MDWEAFAVIGMVVLVVGVVLFLLAKFWMKRSPGPQRGSGPTLRLTKVGWTLVCLMILVLIGGFSMQYVLPQSMIGEFVKTPGGRLIYALLVFGAFWLLEVMLRASGFPLRKPGADARTDSVR